MKIVNSFLFLIIIIITQACDIGIYYTVPQPKNGADIDLFPNSLLGTYYSDSSKENIMITSKQVIIAENHKIAEKKSVIDSSKEYLLKDDELYIKDFKEAVHVKLAHDSVFGNYTKYDTFFNISKYSILREFKKDYFLNLYNARDSLWNVIRLHSPKTSEIEYSFISKKVNYEALKKITKVKVIKNNHDSIVNYIINPTPKELHKIIKKHLFDNRELYHKNLK